MTRWTAVALALLAASLAAVVTVVLRLNARDRAAQLERFHAERLDQVEEAAAEIGEDFRDIADDLRFTGQLVATADTATDRQRELGALLAVVRHYRAVHVYDAEGARVLSAEDGTAGRELDLETLASDMAAAARRARERQPGEVETSPSLDADPDGWLRVFATPLPSGAGALAVLVDLAPLFARLRLLAPQPGTRLLVIGSYGRPTPASDPLLSDIVEKHALTPGLQQLLERMRAGERGQLALPAEEAAALGLGRDEAIGSFIPIELPGGSRWAIATITSTAPLRAHERTLWIRLGVASGAAGLLLAAFAGYVVVTARRAAAARERLRHAEELAALSEQVLRSEKLATVGVLAAGIAHEIGTPLGVVRARAEVIGGKLGADHPLAAGARVIVEQIDRVSRTIRQLLDFSRAGPVTTPQPVDLAQVARAVAELLRFELDRRKLELAVDVPAELPALAGDPDQVQQVLVNLCMNACDACDEGGHVSVRARAEGSRLRIDVHDDGHGVPEELRHRVFDPFFTTKKRGQGTGLGLSLAAQMVRAHRGEIDLDSQPGRGTTVTVRWPVDETRR